MSKGTCPVCNGSGRVPVSPEQQQYKHVYSGYDQHTDTLGCNNCGGQYMFGRPTGEVALRPDGTPCHHNYTSKTVGRCLTEYTCQHCNNRYQIDSGD
jgi:uncharacterized protein YbaR (Trm112 family)